MHVGISLLTLAPDGVTRSVSDARELVRALGRVGELEYTVIVPAGGRELADGLASLEAGQEPAEQRGRSRIPGLARSPIRALGLASRLGDLDVLHYALTMPEPRSEAPTVVTLHDTQHRGLPELFGPARRASRRVAYDRAAREADAVIVASEITRERAAELLEIPTTRFHVVPPAIDHVRFRPGGEQRRPFALYPARPLPHKNHARLFEAFASLRVTRPQLRLVLTGPDLERLGPLPDGVERWGMLTPERLAELYRRAACVVYPSLYEGFCLPPLEAMASGCPVAASNAGAIPEVCGDAAVLFDPTDPEAIAAAILETDERRDELTAKGLARAAELTWDETARRYEAVYREVGGA